MTFAVFVTLAVLVGVSTVGVPVWEVTVPPAVVMLVRDAWYDWGNTHKPSQARDRLQRAGRDTSKNGTTTLGSRAGRVDGEGGEHESHELQDISSRSPTVVSPRSSPPPLDDLGGAYNSLH